MKVPPWLEAIGMTKREEKTRAASGLTPKPDGWYKSIDGRTRYICKPAPVDTAVAALEAKRARLRGTVTVHATHTLTLEQLVETFLASMLERLGGQGKKLARSTYDDYVRTLDAFADVVGPHKFANRIGPDDFTAYMRTISRFAPSTIRRNVQYIDRLFNWAGPGKRSKNLIPLIIRGPDWEKPADDELPNAASDGDKAYEPEQAIRAFNTVKDDPLLNAAAHLALNGAFGPKDLGTLPESLIDLDAAEIRFTREKTGFARLCPLRPETVQAVRTYLTFRARFKSIRPEAVGLLFRTREGMPYARWFGSDHADAGYRDNLLSRKWSKAVGLPLSGLRSTFATLADDWTDQRAVDVVMGHTVGKTGRHIRTKHYAKRFNPDRARKLVDEVWRLAFSPKGRSPAHEAVPPALVSG